MLSPEDLVHRARERCQRHGQPGVGGFCGECFLTEIEQVIADVRWFSYSSMHGIAWQPIH